MQLGVSRWAAIRSTTFSAVEFGISPIRSGSEVVFAVPLGTRSILVNLSILTRLKTLSWPMTTATSVTDRTPNGHSIRGRSLKAGPPSSAVNSPEPRRTLLSGRVGRVRRHSLPPQSRSLVDFLMECGLVPPLTGREPSPCAVGNVSEFAQCRAFVLYRSL